MACVNEITERLNLEDKIFKGQNEYEDLKNRGTSVINTFSYHALAIDYFFL